MIDRVVHHADVLTLKGASYRLPNRGSTPCPASEPKTRHTRTTNRWPRFRASHRPQIRALPTSATIHPPAPNRSVGSLTHESLPRRSNSPPRGSFGQPPSRGLHGRGDLGMPAIRSTGRQDDPSRRIFR
ncbi:hypothetical protein [Pedococcus sp.]|uniref:hypothetical protein n=1 Tax=Pedococcus sp. TaxID=2860345 RepID=UPI002E0DD191|nr:hypothetical protein [Pedococcus sp.]